MNFQLEKLRKIDEETTSLALSIMKADSGKFYSLDFLILAALNRSRININGFLSLLESDNYFAAVTFIRMQLDSVLRLSAMHLVESPSSLSEKILKGVSVRKIKDRSGKQMTDAYLVSMLATTEPWVTKVYESGSGFIHLSNKHIFGMFSNLDNSGKFQLTIGSKQEHITEENKIEAVMALIHITKLLIKLCNQWLDEKQT